MKKDIPIHACQHCGSEAKLVETIIDDEFIWNAEQGIYVPHAFTDMFEHTGIERCSQCDETWTGQ